MRGNSISQILTWMLVQLQNVNLKHCLSSFICTFPLDLLILTLFVSWSAHWATGQQGLLYSTDFQSWRLIPQADWETRQQQMSEWLRHSVIWPTWTHGDDKGSQPHAPLSRINLLPASGNVQYGVDVFLLLELKNNNILIPFRRYFVHHTQQYKCAGWTINILLGLLLYFVYFLALFSQIGTASSLCTCSHCHIGLQTR